MSTKNIDAPVPRFWRDTEVALAERYTWFKPREQQASLVAHMWDVLSRRSHGAIEAPTGTGKGLAIDTPILTRTGWSTMGELQVGDEVHTLDGSLTEITSVSDVKLLKCYWVVFADGSEFVCDEEHLWYVFDEYRNAPGSGKYPKNKGSWRTDNIATIAKKYDISPKHGKNRKFRYGVSTDRVIERQKADLPVDPYLLGWWLGNGHSQSARISTHSHDTEHLTQHLVLLGLPFTVAADRSAHVINITSRTSIGGYKPVSPLMTDLRALGQYRNKHIPEVYLLGDAEQRAALLAGLLDSDGHTSKGALGEFTSTTENLAFGVMFLLRSLGYKASIHEGRATLNGRDVGAKWRVLYSVSVDHHPYRSPRRIAQVTSDGSKQTSTNKIVKVEVVPSVPTRCIAVAHPSRVFLAGESLTPTHNSAAALMVAEALPDRVVISTATRALQGQYRDVDVPRLEEAGLLKKQVVVLDGRGRWMCRKRAEKELNGDLQAEGKRILKKLFKELDKDPSRKLVRDLLPVGVPDWLWTRISSDPDACRTLGCAPGNCAYLTEREFARSAGIVIVNHSLLLADAAIKGGGAVAWGRKSASEDEPLNPAVIGPYRHLIVDEAHALEAAAESFGERRVSVRGIQSLVTRVKKLDWPTTVMNLLEEAAALLQQVTRKLPANALLEPADDGPVLLDAALYAKRAAKAAQDCDADEEKTAVIGAACNSLSERFVAIDSALRFGKDEIGDRAPSAYEGGMVSQLVDVGPWLTRHLWDQVPSVLMSGTLTTPGRAGFVTERVGLRSVDVVELAPVFNYNSQRLVYITPRSDSGGGARVDPDDVSELMGLLDASAGRALVLFPAVQDLRYVHDRLDGMIDHRVLGQGVTPAEDQPRGRRGAGIVPMANSRLAELFRDDTSSVLLATRSFFEGVDFPGESCSLVVVARYPNLRPTDPLVLARRRLIERSGGSSWMSYQEPSMQILFKQAAGRAIRRVDDRGVVAVLDPRSGSKEYARRALLGLLPSDFTDQLGDVNKFLNSSP